MADERQHPAIVALLGEGEVALTTGTAQLGQVTMKDVGKGLIKGAAVAAATLGTFTVVTVPKTARIVVTDRRVLFLDAGSLRKGATVIGEIQREGLALQRVAHRMQMVEWRFDLVPGDGGAPVRLVFPNVMKKHAKAIEQVLGPAS